MILPLRLYAEPVVRSTFAIGCFVLPSEDEDCVCMVVSDHGMIAIALNSLELSDDLIALKIGCSIDCLPSIRIVCDTNKSSHTWYVNGNNMGSQ